MEFREDRRRKAFEENMEKIKQHNEEYKDGKHSFKLSPNNLADLTNQQYLRHYVRLVNSQFDIGDSDNVLQSQYDQNAYPATLDWREKGFITRPSNQKSCGSCYAFSIAHSVEGQLFKKLNRIIELSPQQVSHEIIFDLIAHQFPFSRLSIAASRLEITVWMNFWLKLKLDFYFRFKDALVDHWEQL